MVLVIAEGKAAFVIGQVNPFPRFEFNGSLYSDGGRGVSSI